MKLIIIFLNLLIFTTNVTNACEMHKKKDSVEDLKVINQDGDSIYLYKDLIKDKIFAINFIYTTCQSICIPMSAIFSSASKDTESTNGKYSFISVTLDPKNDTIEKIKRFSDGFHRKSNWQIISTDASIVKKMIQKIGLIEKIDDDHNSFTIIGNEQNGKMKILNGINSKKIIIEEMKKISF